MTRHLRRTAALGAALALGLAACGGSTGADQLVSEPPVGGTESQGQDDAGASAGTGDAAAGATAPAGDPDGLAVATELLDWTAPTLDGGEIRGADFAGRDVVLWMWAPW
ncbi:MAG: hypothetical protein ACLGIR_14075 [Actinomycetes bacterium]